MMEANFRYKLSLEDYAKMCHGSLSTFKRDFRRQFDDTPGRWLQKRRRDFAAVLLRSTEWTVSRIVFESGFEDLSHFSRTFKTQFSASPSAFRKSGNGPDLPSQTFEPVSKTHL